MTEIQALLLIKSILESADIHGIENIPSRGLRIHVHWSGHYWSQSQ